MAHRGKALRKWWPQVIYLLCFRYPRIRSVTGSLKTTLLYPKFSLCVLVQCELNTKLVIRVIFRKRFEIYTTHFSSGRALHKNSGLILGLCLANERCRYQVTPPLIGWPQTLNQPCFVHWNFEPMIHGSHPLISMSTTPASQISLVPQVSGTKILINSVIWW